VIFRKNKRLQQALLLVLLCFSSYSSNAQVSTGPASGQTGNILVIGNGWTGNFSTCTHNVNCWAGSTDGGDIHNAPAGTTGNGSTFYWSGTQQTLTNTIAINSALAAAGIQVDGFDYEWVYKNGNANWFSGQTGGGGVDPFEIVVNVYDSNGNLFKTYRYDYGQNFANWTYDTGTETFGTNFLDPSFFGNVEVLVTGKDIAAQAGYWGPEFRADESGLYVNYSANLCYNNPLHDPTCPGYANALFQQQCTANPLFDSSCPGYAAALLIQQCTANPLHDPSCTGYAQAYYNQQCSLNPLYDSGCTGYQQAYLNQQCKIDPLYDKSCTGHLTAQCNIDPLYDPQCSGYANAYLAQQCDYDPLYDVQCTVYQQAYFDKQCEMDGQFDSSCPNFVAALEEILDDGTTIDPIADALATPEIDLNIVIPEVPVVVVTEIPTVEEPVSAEYEQTQGDMLKMEDDIEREIAELERESEENNEEEDVSNPFEKERDDEKEIVQSDSLPGDSDGEVGTGEAIQEDDIEKEIAALESEANTAPEKKEKKVVTKNDKIRMLLAQKAIELTKQVENAVNIEQQMLVQRQLLALISFVPGFDYDEKPLNDANFYPDKPTVDHQYARWFLNDPNFGIMEDSQYNFK
jgi:hypothetical protein